MKVINNRRGQGVLESLLIMPLVLSFFLLLGLLGLRSLLFYYTDFRLYEAMLCTQHTATFQCENQLRESLKKIPWAPQKSQVYIRSSSKKVEGQVQFRFATVAGFSVADMSLAKKLKLPLQE